MLSSVMVIVVSMVCMHSFIIVFCLGFACSFRCGVHIILLYILGVVAWIDD